MISLRARMMGSVLGGALACLACDPLDEAPGPATPPGVSTRAPEEWPPPPAPAPVPPEGSGDTYPRGKACATPRTRSRSGRRPMGTTTTTRRRSRTSATPSILTARGRTTRRTRHRVDPVVEGGRRRFSAVRDGGPLGLRRRLGVGERLRWGWAPFHYGRWVFIQGRGWAVDSGPGVSRSLGLLGASGRRVLVYSGAGLRSGLRS